MINCVKKTLTEYSMFMPGERVVVGVSGGPDSVCLLYILKHLGLELCLDLCVAHFDHGLRRDSLQDRIFVEKFSCALDIPFFWSRLNCRGLKKRGASEDFLKKHRYDFLLRICNKTKSKKIALGHTQDDQAETVLMRVLRGSGLHGLSAILPKRCLGSVTVVRPLIDVSRGQVLRFLSSHNISYRVDSTNSDDVFMRNKIRNKLLPMLEREYSPGVKKLLADLALNVGADYHYLCVEAQFFLDRELKKERDRFLVDLTALKKLDISIRRLFLRLAIEVFCGDLRALTFQHGQEMEDLLFLRPVGSQVHLPGGVVLLKEKRYFVILRVTPRHLKK